MVTCTFMWGFLVLSNNYMSKIYIGCFTIMTTTLSSNTPSHDNTAIFVAFLTCRVPHQLPAKPIMGEGVGGDVSDPSITSPLFLSSTLLRLPWFSTQCRQWEARSKWWAGELRFGTRYFVGCWVVHGFT